MIIRLNPNIDGPLTIADRVIRGGKITFESVISQPKVIYNSSFDVLSNINIINLGV